MTEEENFLSQQVANFAAANNNRGFTKEELLKKFDYNVSLNGVLNGMVNNYDSETGKRRVYKIAAAGNNVGDLMPAFELINGKYYIPDFENFKPFPNGNID